MSLNASLNIAVQSLMANDGALQATNNNIANVDTPGYTREVVDLQSIAPDSIGGVGGGVLLQGYQSVRDELLQSQIQSQTQSQTAANAQTNAMQQIQTSFTTSSNDIGTEMSALFSSISSLETNPTDTSLRESVIAAGQNLSSAFNSASSSLTSTQTSLNSSVSSDVDQINQLTQQIATLNPQISTMNANGQDAGTLQDQQDQLVLDLSKLTNVSITKTENGITVSTGNGSPLVVSNQSYALQTTDVSGMTHVVSSSGADITNSISGGDLGGVVQTRDQVIPGLLNQLDTLANQFAKSFNAVQAQGYDANGTAGTAFFNLPSSTSGSAASISMAITDPSEIAASSDSSSGGDGNLANFTAVQTTALASGSTPTAAYSNIVLNVGSVISKAQAESSATTSSLQSLNDQLSSVSGVSVDEESTNLIRYQQAYEAAARVVTTVNQLFSVTMAMGTAAAE